MNRWKRSSACLCVPVAAAGSGIADKTGEKRFSSSLLVQDWGETLLDLWDLWFPETCKSTFSCLLLPLWTMRTLYFVLVLLLLLLSNVQSKKWLYLHFKLPFLFCQSQPVSGGRAKAESQGSQCLPGKGHRQSGKWKDVSGARFLLQRISRPKAVASFI